MSEKHIGEVVQVIGPVLDIRFAHDELPALLNAIEIESNGAKLTAEVAQQIGDDVVRCIAMTSPDSGPLSMNVGLLRVEDGLIRLSVDIRHPETAAADHIAETVRRAVEPYGFTLAPIHPEKSVYQDKNGPVMQSLLAAYRQETGDLSAPLAIGGGTYAKAMENIIAFGPVFPGEESREHQADEYIALDNIERLRRIYAQAFQNLLAL